MKYARATVHLRDRSAAEKAATRQKQRVGVAPGERPVSGKKFVRRAYEDAAETPRWAPPLHRPLASRITEHFGVRRVYLRYKGKRVVRRWRGRHMGLDLDGDGGEPIGAVAAGRVVVAGYYFGMGKAVFVDHGGDFFTAYFHMRRIDAKLGQAVARGDVLGRVGSTGLATGPHLHLQARVNGVLVDPLALLHLFGD